MTGTTGEPTVGRPGIVDAHHHFWRTPRHHQHWRDSGLDALARDFGPTDLTPDLAGAGVTQTVLIESLDEPAENDELLRYAAATPQVAGVVGWLPLHDPGLAMRLLDGLSGREIIRGIRCLIGRDPADWLVGTDTIAVLRELARRDLSWDIVPVTPRHIDHVCRLATAVPDLRIVVDHLARPPLEKADGSPGPLDERRTQPLGRSTAASRTSLDAGWQPWAAGITRLASCPNVALKVSVGIDVLTAWQRWDPDLLRRYVEWATVCFGPDRLMLASNWPVITLRRSYADTLADLTAALPAGLSPEQLVAVQSGNARRWYQLADPAGPLSVHAP
ncbi:MAG TPA: amidohydrolase family protein [Actinopolymorphaceae bacterium]|nr:amidohydrolase family protein [Actinopolymorphaceae bacterium]